MPICLSASPGSCVALAWLVPSIVALGAGATYLAMEGQADRVTALTKGRVLELVKTSTIPAMAA